MNLDFIEKHQRLSDPVMACGDQLYVICTQNGLFPDTWATDHSPHEMEGVWAQPIKLLDGYWFAVRSRDQQITGWLNEAICCRVYATYTEFDYRVGPLRITRRDFVPDGETGLIVTISISAPPEFSNPPAPSDAASVQCLLQQGEQAQEQGYELLVALRSDLRPAWLGAEVGMKDGVDHARADAAGRWVEFGDALNPWSLIVGGDVAATRIDLDALALPWQQTHGQGANATLILPLSFASDGTAQRTIAVASSLTSSSEAVARHNRLLTGQPHYYTQKQATYQAISQQSQLYSPSAAINAAFHWSKINSQWLARDVSYFHPTATLAAAAGFPSYPWWFGIDNEYAVLPMLQAGLFDLTISTLRLLKKMSEKHNSSEPGRVIHELSSTGVVYNPGNLVETPAFTSAVYQTWCWTGDNDFLLEMYPFCKQGMLDYALGQCDPDGDLCPAGRSIIETLEMHAGFECIDPAAYTWKALHDLAEMAQAVGDTTILPDLAAKATELGRRIREEWWLPQEGLFADIRASIGEVKSALANLDEWTAQSPDAGILRQRAESHRLFAALLAERAGQPEDVDLPWLLRHWVVLCPAEVGLATPEQAQQLFDRLESSEFCNRYGMMLHPNRADVMSINTGLLALAETRYGRTEQALHWVETLASLLNARTPGAISEALPDQWCFVQLWSALGILAPVVEGFLGIQPNAAKRSLRVVPKLPVGWDQLELRQLQIGENRFDLRVVRGYNRCRIEIGGDAEEFSLEIGAYLPAMFGQKDATVQQVTINGKPVPWHWQTTNAGQALVCQAWQHQQTTCCVIEWYRYSERS